MSVAVSPPPLHLLVPFGPRAYFSSSVTTSSTIPRILSRISASSSAKDPCKICSIDVPFFTGVPPLASAALTAFGSIGYQPKGYAPLTFSTIPGTRPLDFALPKCNTILSNHLFSSATNYAKYLQSIKRSHLLDRWKCERLRARPDTDNLVQYSDRAVSICLFAMPRDLPRLALRLPSAAIETFTTHGQTP